MFSATLMVFLTAVQISAEDARRPRVDICSAQPGYFDRHRGVERPDGSIWWWPDNGSAVPFDRAAETTARQRPWFRSRTPLVIDGVTYRYSGLGQPGEIAFNRYYGPTGWVDGVPRTSTRGQDVMILPDPVDCIFAVWSREED